MKKVISLSLFILLSAIFLAGCGAEKTENLNDEVDSDTILDNKIFEEAAMANDLSRCNDIKDTTKADECKKTVDANVISSEAVKNLNSSMCDEIELDRYKENCKTTIDIQIEEKEKATKAEQEAQRREEKRIDAEQNAIKTGDADKCNEIEDENQKYSCRYNVLTNQAIDKKDLSLCDEIGQELFIQNCKERIGN